MRWRRIRTSRCGRTSGCSASCSVRRFGCTPGRPVLDTVEHVRALAKASRRRGDDFDELSALLGGLPVEAAMPLARAFTHFLNLANVAEQHHRIRRRRAYLQTSDVAAAARIVRGDVRAARHGPASPPRRLYDAVSRAAHRAGAHGPSDRGVTPHADSQIQPHRGAPGRARSSRPDRPGARRAHVTPCVARSRRRGRPTKSGIRSRRRSTRCAAV